MMALRKVFERVMPVRGARELPTPPTDYPAVRTAADLVARAQAERARSAAALEAAQTALAEHEAAQTERLLAQLETEGVAADDDDHQALTAAVAAARRRLTAADGAVAAASARHRTALDAAVVDFSAAVRPLLEAAMRTTRERVSAAIEANDTARELAAFARQNGATSCPEPWEAALSLPSTTQLAELTARQEAMFAPAPPLREGLVLVRWLVPCAPYIPGEVAALDEADAKLHVLALDAEFVHEADVRRLGLRIQRFTKPQLVHFTRNFVHQAGRYSLAGSEQVLDAVTASKVVNLDYGRSLGDANAE